MRAACSSAVAALAMPFVWFATPGLAQGTDSVKELMGKAQSESERRAVEDLINKLQGRAPAAKAAPAPAVPPAATAPAKAVPAPQADSAKSAPVAPVAVPDAAAIKSMAPQPVVVAPQAPAQKETLPAVADPAPARATPETEYKAAPAVPAPAVPTPKADSAKSAAPPATPSRTAAPKQGPAQPAATTVGMAPAIADREQLPTVDLEVYFEFASAKLSPEATATLVTLGRTLSDPRLADQTFIIGGYTDGKGKPDYNLRLSQQRSDMVRQFLIDEFRIAPKRLIAKGFGNNKFKNATDPLANENRRVQVINWTSQLQP